MYLERATIRRLERILLVGSIFTLAAGLALLFFPSMLLELLAIETALLFFVQMSGLFIATLGIACVMTLLDREKNRGILALAFFQKLGVAVLITVAAVLGKAPVELLAVAVFDGVMAGLFLIHLQGARTDSWL